jgi:hypothetical protein
MKARFLAGVLTTLWAGFWGYFVIASLISEPGDTLTRLKVLAFTMSLLGSALWAAWTRSPVGRIWLVVVGIGLCAANIFYFHNPLATRLFLFVTLALPPLVAGLLKRNSASPAGRAGAAAV